jgi:hypothetical protein
MRRTLTADEVEARLQKRYQIINLWRPIAHPAFDTPLALCDYRTVDYDQDLLATRMIFPGREGENFAVLPSTAHRWKYVSGLRPDEYVLIKWYVFVVRPFWLCADEPFSSFDTKDEVARLTPHTAFTDPSTPADAPARQSIELRALVFYD